MTRLKKSVIVLLLFTALAVPAAFARATDEVVAPTAAAAASGAGGYHEAPMLAAMVKAGTLPPVDQRLPKNPKVIESVEGIGKYGGDLVALAIGDPPNNNDLQGNWGTCLLRIPRSGIGVEPDIAEGYEIVNNADGLAIGVKFFLREGMKWSDGSPFTSEDVRFMYEDMHFNPNVTTWGSGGITRVEVIDPLTFILYRDSGLGTTLLALASLQGSYSFAFQPSAYLKQFHIDYNPKAQDNAKAAGFDTWNAYMQSLYFWNPMKNPDKPQVEPWDLQQYNPTARVYVRNPYFFRVDTAGNQLPYVDRLLIQVVDNETYQLKVTGGEASIAYMNTSLENMQLYKANEKIADYRVILHPGIDGSEVKLISNLTSKDPVKGPILADVRFRQAMSVAVDREEIKKVIYQGLGVPRQMSPIESASFYDPAWGSYYAQYDPALANKILDDMGLNKKDANGFRLMSNGQPISIVLSYTKDIYTAEVELISEYLNKVGIKSTIGLVDVSLLDARRRSSEYDFWVHPEVGQPLSTERAMYANSGNWSGVGYAWEWSQYLTAKQTAVQTMLGKGVALPANWRRLETPGDKDIQFSAPPSWWLDFLELGEKWAQTEMGSADYTRIAKQYIGYGVNNLFVIGFVGEVPKVMIAKNGLGNVLPPGFAKGQGVVNEYVQAWMDQLYWK